MTGIGILQGRLSPAPAGRPQRFPIETWRQEFAQARAIGFDAIEWLITSDHLDANPLWHDAGLEEIRTLATSSGVHVRSICADCFIGDPLVDAYGRARPAPLAQLRRLTLCAARLGCRLILVPVLEESRLRDRRHAQALIDALQPLLELAADHDVAVALESDWDGASLAGLLNGASRSRLRAYYDIGNAVADGRDPCADLHALADQVAGVHLKDRNSSGGSVPLGEGVVNLAAVFEALHQIRFNGTPILETPAGDDPTAAATAGLRAVRAATLLVNTP